MSDSQHPVLTPSLLRKVCDQIQLCHFEESVTFTDFFFRIKLTKKKTKNISLFHLLEWL